MKLKDVLPPSKFLKVGDVDEGGGHLDLTIKNASWSTFQDGKPSLDLEFHETDKTFGCNPTNRKRLMFFFGEDIDESNLIGRVIRIGKEMTEDPHSRKPIWGSRIIAGKGAPSIDAMVEDGASQGSSQSAGPDLHPATENVPTYDELNPPPQGDDDGPPGNEGTFPDDLDDGSNW